MRRGIGAAAMAAELVLAAPAFAQANCVPGVAWTYTGTAKGKAFVKNSDKATILDFTPAGFNKGDSVVFSSANPADAGTYQVNADIDVTHLSDEATFTLDGATSAAAGRAFDVTMAAGDGGSSGFSRPITTTGQPFTIALKTQAHNHISIRIRNFVVCKLR